jgi:hypothetical protein
MQRSVRRLLPFAALAPLLALLTACGGDNIVNPSPPPTTQPPPPPEARIAVTPAGRLVVHPSADRKFAIALETPLKIQETGGGKALWAYARLSLLKSGKEVERNDFGVTDLRGFGVSNIDPNSSHTYALVFRFNASDFDEVAVTLGFQDTNSGKKITIDVPPDSFPGVDVNFTPMSVPSDHVVRIE